MAPKKPTKAHEALQHHGHGQPLTKSFPAEYPQETALPPDAPSPLRLVRHCLRALNRHSEADFRPSPEMQVSTAPPLCPTGVSFLLAHSTLLSTPLRRGQAGARGIEMLESPEAGKGSCFPPGSWGRQRGLAPPAATLGQSLVPPPLLLALSFRWGKISTNRLFTKIS